MVDIRNKGNKVLDFLKQNKNLTKQAGILAVPVLFAVVGFQFLISTFATTPALSLQPEN
jgi:hypothetical protein